MSPNATPMIDYIHSFPSSSVKNSPIPQRQPSRFSPTSTFVEPSGIPAYISEIDDEDVLHYFEKEFLSSDEQTKSHKKRIDIMKDGTIRVTTVITEIYERDALFTLFDTHSAHLSASTCGPHRERTRSFKDIKSIFDYGSPTE